MGLNRRRWLWGLAVAGGLAAITYLYMMDPHQSGNYPGCPFYVGTGLYCPGCGTLRAMHCLLHGRVADAASRNVLALALLPLAAYAAIIDLTQLRPIRLGRREVVLPALPYKTPMVVLIVVLVYWVVRNLPWFPFNLLAPAG